MGMRGAEVIDLRNDMETDKPLISILMAVYEPQLDWLKKQLASLEAQTYPNLRLFIRDDCSPTVPYEDIRRLAAECITSIPYELRRNETNLGSNLTFQKLTEEAEGDYFAYCDQDDIWLPEKLEVLQDLFSEDVSLAYCDMKVIDEEDKVIFDSLRGARPRLKYVSGKALADTYFFRNCSAGCASLVKSVTAKKAVPFPRQTVYDHWIATIAALSGEICFAEEQMVLYRQHSKNQTGILRGVHDKQTYIEQRITPLVERLQYFSDYTAPDRRMKDFIEARENGDLRGIWKGRSYSPYEALFEMLAMSGSAPSWWTKWLIKKAK